MDAPGVLYVGEGWASFLLHRKNIYCTSSAHQSGGLDQLVNKDGLLCRCFESLDGSSSNLQLVVPRQLCREVLQELHEGATSAWLFG